MVVRVQGKALFSSESIQSNPPSISPHIYPGAKDFCPQSLRDSCFEIAKSFSNSVSTCDCMMLVDRRMTHMSTFSPFPPSPAPLTASTTTNLLHPLSCHSPRHFSSPDSPRLASIRAIQIASDPRGSRLRARDSVRRVLLLCLQVFSVVSCPAMSHRPTLPLQSATLPQDFRTDFLARHQVVSSSLWIPTDHLTQSR